MPIFLKVGDVLLNVNQILYITLDQDAAQVFFGGDDDVITFSGEDAETLKQMLTGSYVDHITVPPVSAAVPA